VDIGCAVGGASFELARAFPHVLGIDFSQHFVNAANVSEGGWGLVAVGQGEQLASSGLPQTVRPGDAHCSRPCWRCSLPFHRRPVPPQTRKERGWMRYTAVEEGDITVERSAVVPEDIDRSRVRFQQASLCVLCRPVRAWMEIVL